MQHGLFSDNESQSLPLADAKVQYLPNWLDNKTANTLFDLFLEELDWQEGTINIFGKTMKIPRLQAWYGDVGTDYTYSGVRMQPLPWQRELHSLKAQCEQQCETQFNSVLANLYRHGQDSMGMHSDDEPELGCEPVIASVSLGELRNFDFKHKVSGEKFRLPLEHGSLLIMRGETQKFWQHGIAKTKQDLQARMNFTFRRVLVD
ncbi:alpha-ketoglutarate-dependent dioxygenase AlkB family protein [Glaciecola sp. MF2-115]|uniref:alpha-ketoglutarate-dependent dioxygenase AlkB family protein n=1 Tax=Glaciecola sp. MF2-115 TaxID=3384827 RepID=UPI0039A2EBA1